MEAASPSEKKTSTLTINGTSYNLVASIQELAQAVIANANGAYALADNYDAAKDGVYRSSPISVTFNGDFEGLGNAISNFTLRSSTEYGLVGLFAELGQGGTNATIENLRLLGVNITASGLDDSAGAIAAISYGTIQASAVEGTVAGKHAVEVGGLVGTNYGTVVFSRSLVAVYGPQRGDTGGLVGFGFGGLANSFASGPVVGGQFVGGLVGSGMGEISNSFASGNVYGVLAGGLVGESYGVISNSYSTGNVSGRHAGELGGLVGISSGAITNSYATGNLAAGPGAAVGGLVGHNYAPISDSYSTGEVSGGNKKTRGGLIGFDEAPDGSLSDTYWDTDTSGIVALSQGAGNIPNDPGIAGLSTTQLQAGLPAGFDPQIWMESKKLENGLPFLIANPPHK